MFKKNIQKFLFTIFFWNKILHDYWLTMLHENLFCCLWMILFQGVHQPKVQRINFCFFKRNLFSDYFQLNTMSAIINVSKPIYYSLLIIFAGFPRILNLLNFLRHLLSRIYIALNNLAPFELVPYTWTFCFRFSTLNGSRKEGISRLWNVNETKIDSFRGA